jgi:hypothetical protein
VTIKKSDSKEKINKKEPRITKKKEKLNKKKLKGKKDKKVSFFQQWCFQQ